MLALIPPRGSVAASVQAALPASLGRRRLPPSARPRRWRTSTRGSRADVLVCSDHPEAIAATVALVDRSRGLRPLDAGSSEPGGGHRGLHRRLHHPEHPLQGAQHAAHAAESDGATSTTRPGGRWSPSSPARWSRCTPAASPPTTPPTSVTPPSTSTFDVLQRRLRDLGHETRCVRNVTDVDDDILRKARELGVHYLDLAAEEMARFDADMGLLEPACRCTPSPGPPRPSRRSSR